MSIVLLKAEDRASAIAEVLLSKAFDGLNRESLLKSALERESFSSTEVGHSVALAHGKVRTLHKVHAALGIKKEGLKYPQGHKVTFLFVIATDYQDSESYLEFLKKVLFYMHDEDFEKELLDWEYHQGLSPSPKLGEFLNLLEFYEEA